MAVNREEFLKVFDETIGNREEDQELLESYEDDAKVFLPKLQNNNFPLYGLIGEYGTGKSTFLNAVKHYDQQDSETNNIRITFESRKYPDRKELWDAFIIEVLSQIISHLSINSKEAQTVDIFKEMDGIKKKMLTGQYTKNDQNTSKANRTKECILRWLKPISKLFSTVSFIEVTATVVGNIIKGTIEKSKESVSRIFDYEYFFTQYWTKIIQKYHNDFNKVYIIIEDIDRCGDDGLIFLETLSYFVNTISKEEYMMDKMTCVVSIGQGFLNDHRHLINKAITSYEIFNMKTDSIVDYFTKAFSKKELGFSEEQKRYLNDFLSVYLNIHGSTTRTIREIKYLFKKILPEMIEKKELLNNEGVSVSDDIILGMILYNFSLFIRSNKIEKSGGSFSDEIFDSMKSLHYCRMFNQLGNNYFYIPYMDIRHGNSLSFFHKEIFSEIFTLDQVLLSKSYTLRLSKEDKDIGMKFTVERLYPQNPHSDQYYLNISDYWLLNS